MIIANWVKPIGLMNKKSNNSRPGFPEQEQGR